jgi:lipopolysaccharide transport system ATP-binding protein
MSNLAIRVENLGKIYHIGGPQEQYKTFRDAITNTMLAPFRRTKDLLRGQAYWAAGLKEQIWALKDVSFEVKHGETVGIIGRNGAGKSTLLKILSRITEPTTGYAEVHGRVGALLEVGTGFHPELTGRENVYLNGAILGMSRRDIKRKFDEIVDFAGVQKFIDTPVKHYSSGMGLRLGFAVAAHLELEILIVDEVLAVGDAEFQKKCLGKMSNIANEGRTVLFVSHNMTAVRNLCQRGLILDGGRVIHNNAIDVVVDRYTQSGSAASYVDLSERTERQGSGVFRFTGISLRDETDSEISVFQSGQPITVHTQYQVPTQETLSNVSIAFRFEDLMGQYLFTAATAFTTSNFDITTPTGVLVCHIPSLPLTTGHYRLFLWSDVNGQPADAISDAIQFSVSGGDVYGTGHMPTARLHGAVFIAHEWSQQPFPLNHNLALLKSQANDG